jgi:voltage-gated potassium channel
MAERYPTRIPGKRVFMRRAAFVVIFVVALMIVGTIGFLQIPGWSLSDAWYMTVITLSAVGFEEVRDLNGNTAGRLLVTFLLAGGLTAMGLWFAFITASIVEMDLAHVFRKRRTMKEIGRIRQHIIVCGAGRTGRQVVREIEAAGVPYVVIERDADQAENLREQFPEALVIEGDATHDEALVEARVGAAKGLVSCLSADTDNLFVCLSARDLQPNLTIVARAYDEETMKKLYKAGADHVVSPNLTGGIRMASMLVRPQVVSFLDVVTRGDGLSLRLEQVRIPSNSALADHTLAEAQLRQKTGLIVIAVRRMDDREQEGTLIYNPGPDAVVRAGDVLIVLGSQDQIDGLVKAVSP